MTENGICIDPKRVEAIQQIALPRNKKELQSFLGKINFLRRFVPNFAELIKHINCMLKKWNDAARNSFVSIKTALKESPVLVSPNFEKDFLTFSYASEETVAAVKMTRALNNQFLFLVVL